MVGHKKIGCLDCLQEEDGSFRNFTLVELSHLEDADLKSKKPLQLINERLSFGKKMIDRETNPGDVVMIESPEEYSYQDYNRLAGKKASRKKWEELEKHNLNFYYNLAAYARRKGRAVVSVDTGLMSPAGRLQRTTDEIYKIYLRRDAARIEFLAYYRRNIFMQRRIQARKPKLVIVASGHAIHIENVMNPKKVIFNSKYWNNSERKRNYIETQKSETKAFLADKKMMRRFKIKMLGLKMKKNWKPKI